MGAGVDELYAVILLDVYHAPITTAPVDMTFPMIVPTVLAFQLVIVVLRAKHLTIEQLTFQLMKRIHIIAQ